MMPLYTIGHSNLTIEQFIENLKTHNVEFLVDVRSSPFSRHFPQYNQDLLRKYLNNHGIKYLFLGKELGARTNDLNCYVDGKVSYEKLSATPLFQSGLERVKTGSVNYKLCLMCAEQDPIECHRTILVCKNLQQEIPNIFHILKNGNLQDNNFLVKRLLEKFNLDFPDFSRTETERINEAFIRQGDKIAYMEEQEHE